MKQRGFILPSGLTLYAAIGAAVIIGLLSIALKVQSSRLEATKAEYAAFVATTKAIGEKAQAEAKLKETQDKLAKEKADNENQTNRARLAVLTKRLRDSNSGSSLLPAIPTNAGSAETITFDRPSLDRALSSYEEGIAGLIEEGDKAIIDLNTAKQWAKNWPANSN